MTARRYLRLVEHATPRAQAAASFEAYKRRLVAFNADPTLPNAEAAMKAYAGFLIDYDADPDRTPETLQSLAAKFNTAMVRAELAALRGPTASRSDF
ncbi:MAG: hypothetical protein AAFX92_03920 [Pseudomonadota bacterium]